jgi:hypothetical protein
LEQERLRETKRLGENKFVFYLKTKAMKANKLFRISEIMWLVIGIACILTDLYIFVILHDVQRGLFFLGLTFMASLMYFVRRRMRIRADAAMGENDPANSKKKKNGA